MLNFKDIKEKYPKSYSLLTKWTKNLLEDFQKSLVGFKNPSINKGLEIPEITDDMAERSIEGMFSVNFRNLYDFFDQNAIYLYITFNMGDGRFVNNFSSYSFENRKGAEIDGFENAFKTLESRI